VLFIGSDQTTEAENFDRQSITLAGVQEHLLNAVLAANPKTIGALPCPVYGPKQLRWILSLFCFSCFHQRWNLRPPLFMLSMAASLAAGSTFCPLALSASIHP
jgi:hypothetical protein